MAVHRRRVHAVAPRGSVRLQAANGMRLVPSTRAMTLVATLPATLCAES